jgi:hypothetical protein
MPTMEQSNVAVNTTATGGLLQLCRSVTLAQNLLPKQRDLKAFAIAFTSSLF